MQTAATLSATTKDLVVLQPGEGVLDVGSHLKMLGVIGFLSGQQIPAELLAARDDEAGVDVRAGNERC